MAAFERSDLATRFFIALINPFSSGSYDIDENSLRKLVRHFIDNRRGQRIGLVVNPEAGEIFYLSREEKRRTARIVIEEAAGEVPVFAGVLDVTTKGTLEVAADMKALGVDGLFLMPPIGAMDITTSWNPSRYPEVWLDQILEIDAEANLPIITHPVGSHSLAYGNGLPEEVALAICRRVPNVVGWKMTYNWDGWKRVGRSLRKLSPKVGVLGAPAGYFHEALASGLMDGTVTGSFNYAYEPMLDHIAAWQQGDAKKALAVWDSGLHDLQEWIYSDFSRLHVRYKIGAWLRGLVPHPYMRPPMPRPSREEVETLERLLRSAGLAVIDDTSLAVPQAQLSAAE